MLPQGFRVPERRAEKSRSPCAMGSVDAVGATGLLSGTGSGSGSGKVGAESTGTVFICTAWVGAAAEVCVPGATSHFGGVTAGLGGVQSRREGATELPLGRPSVPGSASPVGERVAFAWGTVLRVIEAGT